MNQDRIYREGREFHSDQEVLKISRTEGQKFFLKKDSEIAECIFVEYWTPTAPDQQWLQKGIGICGKMAQSFDNCCLTEDSINTFTKWAMTNSINRERFLLLFGFKKKNKIVVVDKVFEKKITSLLHFFFEWITTFALPHSRWGWEKRAMNCGEWKTEQRHVKVSQLRWIKCTS